MNITQTLIPLLIDINQETLFKYLGIDNLPFSTAEYANNVELSTPITGETLRIILQEIARYYQKGLGFVDLENLALIIIFIRFFYLIKKYNLLTAFYISGICLWAGYLWYAHLKDFFCYFYGKNMLLSALTAKMGNEYLEITRLAKARLYQNAKSSRDSDLFYGPMVRGLMNLIRKDGYNRDGLSMLFANVPEDSQYRVLTDKIYYTLTLKIIPPIYSLFNKEVVGFIPIAFYTYVTRVNKTWCPYLVRWHWTMLIVCDYGERFMLGIHRRIGSYTFQTLIPKYEKLITTAYTTSSLKELESININKYQWRLVDNDLMRTIISFFDTVFKPWDLPTQIEFGLTVVIGTIVCQYIFIVFGMLHALCGQYFYLPFFTENTELHVGRRPRNSLYSGGWQPWTDWSGGSTAWQSSRSQKIARNSLFPRLWYGWFGQGDWRDLDDIDKDNIKRRDQKRINEIDKRIREDKKKQKKRQAELDRRKSAEKARKRNAKYQAHYAREARKQGLTALKQKLKKLISIIFRVKFKEDNINKDIKDEDG